MNRRSLIIGLGALLCAPAIVRASSLMPVKAAGVDPEFVYWYDDLSKVYRLALARSFDEFKAIHACNIFNAHHPIWVNQRPLI